MRKPLFVAVAFLIFASSFTSAQETSAGTFYFKATRITQPPVIDGILNDDCWIDAGEWSGTFTRQQPDEGQPETEETHVKILYDDHNIYVGYRLFDSEPEKINRWLSPRDIITGDAVAIIFDSYNDKRTGFGFVLTAGGTKADFVCENSDNDDYTWNAVWEGRTSHDDKGWYAEFRIPLSQLRYSGEKQQEWGFHAIRRIDRKNELDHLHLIPQNNKGLVFSFGRLTGISDLPKSRRIELAPYASLKFATSGKTEGNPYATGREWTFGAGLDGKIGLSSDFTLDFSFNPDFGQVEADPSTINLSAYETYYEEKRPFFLEGKKIFNIFGQEMFYSRRVGSRPKWRPEDRENRYSRVPPYAHILSAVKVSGKSKRGLSLGILNSLTGKTYAKITENGKEYEMTAEPFTSYSVARVQQDFNEGNMIIGGIVTSTNRSLNDDHLSSLVRNAYTGGVDFTRFFNKREFYLTAGLLYSNLSGTKEAVTVLQESPVHYFRRKEASHLKFDPSKTTLQGTSGSILFGRGGGKKIVGEELFTWISPGFDVNDVGFMQRADFMSLRGHIGYVENQTKGIFHNFKIFEFHRFEWDFGGTYTFGRTGIEAVTNLKNKWYAYICGFYDLRTVDIGMLRGGPPLMLDPRWGTDMVINTDQSKKLSGSIYYGTMLGRTRFGQFSSYGINWRPTPGLSLSPGFEYHYVDVGLEYVGQESLADGGKAYLMGALKQNITGLTLRMDYSITPDFSIRFYGNPFMSMGKYSEFKRATAAMDKKYENRFRLLTDDMLIYNADNNKYSVSEPDGDRYDFVNPDFSFREFRFTLVARWEYRPNSVLYLVWGQDRSGSVSNYNPSFGQNMSSLFGYNPNNVFMIKLNYWFSL